MTSLNGLILVDKPADCTSHDIVARARRILKTSEVGHCGTLDPIATGLMVLLVGQATKLSQYILSQDKRYLVTFRLGWQTDMGDRTGATVREEAFCGTKQDVLESLDRHIGELRLPVPMYSAVKVNGTRLHELARKGVQVDTPTKPMQFYDLKLVKIERSDVEVEISCSKGSFIRAWVEAIGRDLDCGATVMELRRLRSEPYSVAQALTMEKLAEAAESGDPVRLGDAYIPLVSALPEWPAYTVKRRDEILLRNGQVAHELGNRLILEQKRANHTQSPVGIKVLGAGGNLIGILEALPSKGLKIKRIFPERC